MSKGRSATSIIWRTVVYAGAMLAAPGCPRSSSTCVEEPAPEAAIGTTEPEPLPPDDVPAAEGMATVTIVSTPGGAEAYVDGEMVGHTPLRIDVPIGRELTVQVALEGYTIGESTVLAEEGAIAAVALTAQPTASRSRCTNEGRRGRGFILS